MARRSTTRNPPAITEILESRLTSGAIEKADLRKFVKAVSALEKYRIVDWCVLGIPTSEYVCTKFQVKKLDVSSLIKDLLAASDLRIKIDVFPYGIPLPDLFEVTMAFGERPPGYRA